MKIRQKEWAEKIRTFPARLEALIGGLNGGQLHTLTDVDIWTVAQHVHHCANSHMNAFIRLKLTLTEDQPILKNYEQDEWAVMEDEVAFPIEPSLQILRGLHQRWAHVIENIAEDQWGRYGVHTTDGNLDVIYLCKAYTEHGDAHLEQIKGIISAFTFER
jgi:hypothetical protein